MAEQEYLPDRDLFELAQLASVVAVKFDGRDLTNSVDAVCVRTAFRFIRAMNRKLPDVHRVKREALDTKHFSDFAELAAMATDASQMKGVRASFPFTGQELIAVDTAISVLEALRDAHLKPKDEKTPPLPFDEKKAKE